MCSMSAIDFYCSVDKVKGVDGKDRAVVTLDGKFLPYTEQVTFLECQISDCNMLTTWHRINVIFIVFKREREREREIGRFKFVLIDSLKVYISW